MKTSTFRKAFDPINDFDKFENYDPKRKKDLKNMMIVGKFYGS